MALKSDRQGFLIGDPIDGEAALRVLGAIKGDTGKMLAMLRGQANAPAQRRATAMPMPRAMSAASPPSVAAATRAAVARAAPDRMQAAVPAPRATFTRERDAAGRFVSSGGAAAPAVASAEVRAMARATQAIALTQEQARRDQKGRFTAGQGGGRAEGAGGVLSALGGRIGGAGSAAGGALGDAERIDPALAAAAEVKSLVSAAGVAVPAGRAIFGAGMAARGGVQWFRRMFGELRAMRTGQDKQGKDLVKAFKENRGAGGEGGSSLLSMLPLLGSALPALAAAVAPLGIGAAVVALAKRFPALGAIFSLFEGASTDAALQADANLTPQQRAQARGANAGGVAGTIAGLLGGAAAGTAVLPGVGTIIGAGVGAYAGAKGGKALGGMAGEALGGISARFESSRGGAGTISTGKGDFGGVSYGTHQLSSNTGTLQKFLASSGYGAQFAGMQPGSREFNARWREIAAADPNFGKAQKDFITATHFDPQMAKLAAGGIDLSGRGQAVKEAVFSTAVQFGGQTSLIQKALAGRDVAKMSDADIISAVQDYKAANNASLFRSSSPAVQAGTLRRASEEKAALLSMAGVGPAPTGPRMPPLPTMAAPQIPPMPSPEPQGPTRLGSQQPAVVAVAAPAPVRQDLDDRLLAHIATGGISGPIVRR